MLSIHTESAQLIAPRIGNEDDEFVEGLLSICLTRYPVLNNSIKAKAILRNVLKCQDVNELRVDQELYGECAVRLESACKESGNTINLQEQADYCLGICVYSMAQVKLEKLLRAQSEVQVVNGPAAPATATNAVVPVASLPRATQFSLASCALYAALGYAMMTTFHLAYAAPLFLFAAWLQYHHRTKIAGMVAVASCVIAYASFFHL